jgi:prepilin-type N-terminal cleavage/methylation domain-containing protein
MRRGVTLLELVTVLAVIGIVTIVALPHLSSWWDRLATARAARELANFYTYSRFGAIFHGTRVRLEFGADTLRAVYEGVRDSVFLVRPGPSRHGVSLTASRRVIRVHPNGIGRGGANTKLVVRRGAAAESLTTSRLGRLKRWN